ncbi:dihydropyrimidinase [Fusobacterium hominis]|jgi:dihydropyrimidinase|uniref:Dihydropyrimidinase n=1 Tax=Fusobacterium hominis TaxID=2764326 RepID=A0A7G9GWG9_9FUSO|nr:dihydropyrimidinase [Fusobacterium hominis]QNM15151.1 dihydropyrimidinase [Fusobacterium hominis]
MGLLLKNANIVTDKDKFLADVYIENGVISKIGENLNVKAERTIDLTGKYLMPGGIDVHTHFDIDVGIARSADNFYTGSLAAAYGGTTTIVDHMGFGPKGCNLHHQLDYYHNLAKDSVIDYSFHGVIQHIDQNILGEIDQMIEDGIPSFKGYMTYGYKLSDIEMLKLSEKLSKSGGLLTVHPENNDIIDFFREKFAAENKLSPIYHAKSRPDKCEGEAVNRMIDITNMTNCPLYIVHLSCNDALEHIKKAIDKGQKVYAETCPQYLVLDEDLYNRKDGVKYICSPPIREKSHQDKLWEGIQNGYIQTIATDHCSFNYELKKEMGEKDFRNCPNGLPGVETRMSIIFSEGVSKGRINLNKFVELVSTNPAKIFGMYPKKGAIQIGSDADLVVIDPKLKKIITAKELHENVDYTPFEGIEIVGCPVMTISQGEVIVENNKFVGEKGRGKFIKRNPFKS